MNRRIECRSEGCTGEVLFKAVEGLYEAGDRRPGSIRVPPDRASPSGYHRNSTGSTQIMSPYCKQHTCSHFFREEGCNNKKPPHDSVCAVHARCPVSDCNQARAQYLDPKYDYVPGIVPRYTRYELCFDHKCTVRQCQRGRTSAKSSYCATHGCQAEGCLNPSQEQRNCCKDHECAEEGCRTIVEGDYPYCVIHIKCEIDNCNHARHLMAKTKEYLDYCTDHATCRVTRCREIKMDHSLYCPSHTCRERDCEKSCFTKPYCDEHVCAEPTCEYPRPWAGKPKNSGKFCPMHTCRERNCHDFTESVSLFCKDHGCSKENCLHEAMAEHLCIHHFKEEYMARGERERRAKEAAMRHRMYERPFYPQRRDQDSETDSETVTDTGSENENDDIGRAPPRLFTGSNLSKGSKASKVDDSHGPPRREWTGTSTFTNGDSGNGNGHVNTTSGNSPVSNGGRNAQQPQTKRQKDNKRHWVDVPSPRGSVTSRMESTDSLLAENGEAFSGFNTDGGGSSIHPVGHASANSGKPVNGKRISTMT